MSKERVQSAFKDHDAFIAFITAGDPDLESTGRYLMALQEAGADLIEIGIPFSDPTAEGPVIQEANIRALKNGVTTDDIFDMVARLRANGLEVPLAVMTYMNVVFVYGIEKFCRKCDACGIDLMILPDLPYEEDAEVKAVSKDYDVALVSMVAPTSHERIRQVAADAEGFLYVVSSLGVTGARDAITTDLKPILEAIRRHTDVPAAVGFGISKPEQAAAIGRDADGVIVGSAIVRIIAENGRGAQEALKDYVRAMKAAVAGAN